MKLHVVLKAAGAAAFMLGASSAMAVLVTQYGTHIEIQYDSATVLGPYGAPTLTGDTITWPSLSLTATSVGPIGNAAASFRFDVIADTGYALTGVSYTEGGTYKKTTGGASSTGTVTVAPYIPPANPISTGFSSGALPSGTGTMSWSILPPAVVNLPGHPTNVNVLVADNLRALAGTPLHPTTLTKSDAALVVSVISVVPEPETYALMLAGLGALAFLGRRRTSD